MSGSNLDISDWQPLTGEERAWLEVVRSQRENIALRQELLAREEVRVQGLIAQRLGLTPVGIEVDMSGGRVRSSRAVEGRKVTT